MKKALILGVFGQDGSYMAELLSAKGYEVHGIGRGAVARERFDWLKGLCPNIFIHLIHPVDKQTIEFLMAQHSFDEIYNFAGVTDTFAPFGNAENVLRLNALLPTQILEAIKGMKIKFFNASSCLTCSNGASGAIHENSPYSPMYPYGASKVYAETMIKMYREKFGVFACSGIFFPHESERRREGFFTRKVVDGVVDIVEGRKDKLEIGNLDFSRDWGYAPEYMEAVYLMMQRDTPEDYVIGTGKVTTGLQFVFKCFEYVGLNAGKYLVENHDKKRTEQLSVWADASKIKADLGWEAKTTVDEIVKKMIDAKRTV